MFQGILCGDSLTKAPPFGVTKWDDPPSQGCRRAAELAARAWGPRERWSDTSPEKMAAGWFCVCGITV